MSSKSKVCFFFQDTKIQLANRTLLKNFISKVFNKEGKKLGLLNIIFCTDSAILDINRTYLNHDFYTDIITFDLSESNAIQAEIYISVERVKENAQNLGISFKSEIHRIIFHGILHLCGYDDKTNKEKEKMRKNEDYLLNNYKLSQ